MRFHRTLDDLLAPPSRLKVLREMFRNPAKDFTGRELASLAGISHPAGNHALEELERTGIVQSRRAGAAHLWRLSPEHRWTPRLSEMFRAEAQARDELISFLRARLRSPPVLAAALYGSVARSEETSSSDIDLLLIVRSEREARTLLPRLARLQAEVARKFGSHLAPLVCTEREWRGHAWNRALIETVRKEGTFLLGSA